MKRIVSLDYLRVFACFLVILVHASENFYAAVDASGLAGPQSFLANEADRLWVSIYDGFARMSVPLFMMLSAYLLVPLKPQTTMWQFYKSRAKRIVTPVLLFMVLYSLLPLLWGATDVAMAKTDMSRLLLNFPSLAGHLWFMYPLIGLYLFMPIVSPWLQRATAKEELFVIGLFLLSTCMPYLNRWFGDVWGECFWNQYHMLWNFAGYFGYLVLAHYIKVHIDWSRSKRFVVGLCSMVIGAFITIYSFYVQATPGVNLSTPVIELGWAFCTINCVMLTFGAFLLFGCIESEKAPAIVTDLSKLSFGIYLVHLFWLGTWVTLFKDDMAMPSVAAIPAITVATFVTSYLTCKIVSYIPGSKWLIG